MRRATGPEGRQVCSRREAEVQGPNQARGPKGRHSLTVRVILAACLALLPVLAPRAGADDNLTLEQIIDAWKSREGDVQSFDFRWRSKHFESASYTVHPNSAGKEDATFFFRYRFVGDVECRFRFEYNGREWDHKSKQFVAHTSI